MKLRKKWRYYLPNDGLGLHVDTHAADGRVFFTYKTNAADVVAAIDFDGKALWSRSFAFREGVSANFRAPRIFVLGDSARLLAREDGQTVAERSFGEPSSLIMTDDATPAVWLEQAGQLVGLHPATLEDAWSWPDPVGAWQVETGAICLSDPIGRLRRVRLDGLVTEIDVAAPPSAMGAYDHCHLGDRWCAFFPSNRYCVDVRTAEVRWLIDAESDRAHHFVRCLPQHGIALAREPKAHAYSLETGALLWTQDYGFGKSVILTDRFVCAYNDWLYMATLPDGNRLWEQQLEAGISCLVVNGPHLFVGHHGALDCYETDFNHQGGG